MREKSVIGEAAAYLDRYDWAAMALMDVVMLVAILLGAPLWAVAAIPLGVTTVISVRAFFFRLLPEYRELEAQEAAAAAAEGRTFDPPKPVIDLRPLFRWLRPHATDKP
jgi:fatty acid desaturase